MAVEVLTYVSSSTYDTLLNIMYPDVEAKLRAIPEVERLIVQGHTVEYRFGMNQSTVLDMDKFNTFIRPKAEDEVSTPVNINEIQFQAELNSLSPVAPHVEPEEVVEHKNPVEIISSPVVLNTVNEVKPAEEPEKINLEGEEVKFEEKPVENAGKTKKDIVENKNKPSTNKKDKENKRNGGE